MPAEIQKPRVNPQTVPQEVQLTFVEVDPATATPEAPKNAKYYSSKNSLAANPNPTVETQQPKIDGTQTHVAKTETTPRTKQFPLQPSAPKAPQDKQAADEAQPKPKGGAKPGDLAFAKPDPKPTDGKSESDKGDAPSIEPHKRWRTLAEAEMHQSPLVGEKMKQDGGVKRSHVQPSFDTKATAFGAYDAQIIAAIQRRWDDLLSNPNITAVRTGMVRVEFRLNYDGRVTDMRVIESTVDDMFSYLCQRAITEPAPFERWPSDMRRLIGADSRVVQFTFFYD
jgi:outer membrane biosynthesis protein TonB